MCLAQEKNALIPTLQGVFQKDSKISGREQAPDASRQMRPQGTSRIPECGDELLGKFLWPPQIFSLWVKGGMLTCFWPIKYIKVMECHFHDNIGMKHVLLGDCFSCWLWGKRGQVEKTCMVRTWGQPLDDSQLNFPTATGNKCCQQPCDPGSGSFSSWVSDEFAALPDPFVVALGDF